MEVTHSPFEHCQHCALEQTSWNQLLCAFDYQAPLSELITRFKYQAQLANSRVLAHFLKQRLEQHYQEQSWPEVIIPVPLHWSRQAKRGFNQSLLLARDLQLPLPIDTRFLKRYKKTAPQESLGLSERKNNLSEVFSLNLKNQGYHHIALLDDVVTTGATVDSICQLFKSHGVEEIDVWAVARTPKQQKTT